MNWAILMGLRHDRYVACGHDTASPQCPGLAVAADAYGYVNQRGFESGASSSQQWRTVMSYSDQCDDNSPKIVCDYLSRFSNPSQTYEADPLGVLLTESNKDSNAVDGPANASRVLNETRDTVADFRQGRAVKVSFAAGSYAVTEGGTVTVTVRLDAAPDRNLTIPLTATSTDGAWPGDFTFPASVTFKATETVKILTFSAVQDARQEDAETVTLSFGTPLPNGVTRGSPATATVTLTDDSDAVTGAPSVDVIALTSDPGTAYAAGEEIEVAVVFIKPVTVTGTPQIGLTVGANTRQMTYQAGRSASEVVAFTYTVVADEIDTDGVSIAANSLMLNGGTIQDKADGRQAASRTHVAVEDNSAHPVDGDTPDLVTVVVGENTVTLTYDEALDETAVPWPGAFTLTAGAMTVAVDSVRVAGAVVTLELASHVAYGQSVTLAYAPPAGTPALQDLAGNPAAILSGQVVTNNSPRPIYDTDDDGLIAITTLAQLDAMRRDLDGDGIPTPAGATAYAAAFPGATRAVCGASSGAVCAGYELLADLDFDTDGDGQVDADDDYWDSGAGWEPIGTASSPFNTVFEGNRHTISHLFIERSTTDNVGLFGYTGSSSVLRNVGLIDVAVSGNNAVGGLVGRSSGNFRPAQGFNNVRFSYVTGRIKGGQQVGGLVGENAGGIAGSYATGRVTGSQQVGGLVGQNAGGIAASYATGRVTGSQQIGGLVGQGTGQTYDSYWDTSTSGQVTGTHGEGKTTAELQIPVDYTIGSIYADWNVDLGGGRTTVGPWDFGAPSMYPALHNGDPAFWEEFGYQLRAGPTLTVETEADSIKLSWPAVETSHWTPAPAVTYTVYRDDGSTVEPIAEDLAATEYTAAAEYTDTDVSVATTYTYQVAAVVNGGEATWSGIVEVTTPATLCAAPDLAGRAAVWTGTLTVGRYHAVYPGLGEETYGYGFDSFTDLGTLVPAAFTIGLNTYDIGLAMLFAEDDSGIMTYHPGDLVFSLDRALTATEQAGLVLHVCADDFPFATAATLAYAASEFDYYWTSTDLDWSVLATVKLALSSTADAEMQLEAPVVVPGATVAAVSPSVSEGASVSFTVTLDAPSPAPDGISVAVAVTETGTTLPGTLVALLSFAAGETAATLSVPTVDDTVIEDASTVTATLSAGAGYTLGDPASATLEVTDNDAAEFAVSFGAAEIEEGDSTTLTVEISNGVSFAARQEIVLRVSGTASEDDYTLTTDVLALAAGAVEATATLTALSDSNGEDAETVTVTATHDGATVGTASVTIAANDGLTAWFASVPAEHDGSTVFTLELVISEHVGSMSFNWVRDALLSVTNGTVERSPRVVAGRNDRWTVFVAPASTADVTLTVVDGLQVKDGRTLHGGAQATVAGPAPVSAVVDGGVLTLTWPSGRDGFGGPYPSDYAVTVDGVPRAVATATLGGRRVTLVLAEPVGPETAVTVGYVGSAMHPLADATGSLRSAPWFDLPVAHTTLADAPVAVLETPAQPQPVDRMAAAAETVLWLDASAHDRSRLDGLQRLTALERLNASDNALADLGPLSGLASLREVDLSGNRIVDISALAGLHGLQRLDLSGNRIADAGPLAGLPNLTVLLLDGNPVADAGPMLHLGTLENLGLAGTRVTDVSALADLWSLRRLDLGGLGIADLSPIGDVGTLVWLRVPGHPVGSEDGLGRLTRLRWVWPSAEAGAPEDRAR